MNEASVASLGAQADDPAASVAGFSSAGDWLALLKPRDGLVAKIIEKLNGDPRALARRLDDHLGCCGHGCDGRAVRRQNPPSTPLRGQLLGQVGK